MKSSRTELARSASSRSSGTSAPQEIGRPTLPHITKQRRVLLVVQVDPAMSAACITSCHSGFAEHPEQAAH
eukprot:350649-Chlamydomonas_euryale.AAC.3